MKTLLEQGAFIQVAEFFGNKYGTSVESVERVMQQGKVCILDLEANVLLFVI